MPGLPTVGFLALGAVLGGVGWFSMNLARQRAEEPVVEAPPPEEGTVERATAFLKIDSLAVEIGYGLVGLVDTQVGGDFLSPHPLDPKTTGARIGHDCASRQHH